VAADHGATLRYAIDTHVHADHVSGVRAVASETGAEPVVPAGAADRGLSYAATLVEAGDHLPLGETAAIARDLSGHTTETTGYRFDDVLFTGDSVFLDGVARPDLEDQSRAEDAAGQLWETVQALGDRDSNLTVAPGHVGPATDPGPDDTYTAQLAALRERLLAFEESRAAFVDRVTTGLPPRPANDKQIIAVNLGRETADHGTAFELELGPSNCAAQV
jgi:Zn-dependent hydrolases, including glyoxylases